MTREQKRIAYHIAKLADPDVQVACRAERYLIRYGSRAKAQLLQACESENANVRLRAAWALAHTRDQSVFDVIHKLCFDPDERIRYDCCVALGILGGERAQQALVSIVESGKDDDCALMGLDRMMPEAFPIVAELFRKADWRGRLGLINSVGNPAEKFSIPEAIELLELAAQDENEMLRIDAQDWLNDINRKRRYAEI